MDFATFWDAYQAYRNAGRGERQRLEADGAHFELYVSMGMPRARYQPPRGIDLAAPAVAEALQILATRYRLTLDIREDSCIVLDQDGNYLGRVRPQELLFTPERLAAAPSLLGNLVALYQEAQPGNTP